MARRKGPGGRRKGAGRPALPDGAARSVVWTIKITPAMATAVDDLAATSGTTRAALLLEAIELALARGSTR